MHLGRRACCVGRNTRFLLTNMLTHGAAQQEGGYHHHLHSGVVAGAHGSHRLYWLVLRDAEQRADNVGGRRARRKAQLLSTCSAMAVTAEVDVEREALPSSST